jgi:hypothetical protein
MTRGLFEALFIEREYSIWATNHRKVNQKIGISSFVPPSQICGKNLSDTHPCRIVQAHQRRSHAVQSYESVCKCHCHGFDHYPSNTTPAKHLQLNVMLPKRKFGREEQKRKSGFRLTFSMASGPN